MEEDFVPIYITFLISRAGLSEHWSEWIIEDIANDEADLPDQEYDMLLERFHSKTFDRPRTLNQMSRLGWKYKDTMPAQYEVDKHNQHNLVEAEVTFERD
jgi:hypothetical protein